MPSAASLDPPVGWGRAQVVTRAACSCFGLVTVDLCANSIVGRTTNCFHAISDVTTRGVGALSQRQDVWMYEVPGVVSHHLFIFLHESDGPRDGPRRESVSHGQGTQRATSLLLKSLRESVS